MEKKAVINKDEASENWCFICKDGGDLRICDYGECLKSYHSSCLGKDDSFLESDEYWACAWHTCFKCHRSSYLHCYTCTNAVCRRCLPHADFLRVKGRYGFCDFCLYLVLLIEERTECDSNGDKVKVDFRDRETREGLFMEYYVIVKEKEGFESGDLHAAKDRTKKESESGSEEIDEEEDQISDYEHVRKCRRRCNEKRSGRKKSGMRTPMKSDKNDFIGWGSRSLIGFLSSIGKRTDEKLSQRDVTSIVNEYVKENKLLHPDKRKLIKCDIPLESLFRKKTLSKHRVYELLEDHFAENHDDTEEDEVGYDSDDDNPGIPDVRKRKGKMGIERKSPEKELADNVPLGCFASIVVENVKLLYLRRSLILEMLKQPKTFEEKVVGCFVRVKSDQYDYSSRNSHQLMKVRGVRRVSIDQNNMEVILLISAFPNEISASMLSDDDFSKEECEELRGKILAGQLERPTVVSTTTTSVSRSAAVALAEDLQQKANIVHVDITKHWISKELALLRNLIDRANEKGWRRELFEYLEKKRTLQDPSEVSKLLENVPKAIPDLHELTPNSEDIVIDMSSEKDSPNDGLQDHKASEEKTRHCNASAPERKQFKAEDGNVTSRKPSKSSAEPRNYEPEGEELKMCSQEILLEQQTRSRHKASETAVTELLSNDEISNENKATNNVYDNQSITDLESNIWCLRSPDGEQKKYSLSVLKRWSKICVYASKYKVWKEDENEEDAVWLREMLLEQQTRSSHKASEAAVTELLSDDEISNEGKAYNNNQENQSITDLESKIWCLRSPDGVQKKYSLSVLKRWSEISVYASKFKVWKEDENEEDAVWLHEVLSIALPKK